AVRLLRHRPDLASVDELARWLFVVARNVVIDGTRRRLTTVPLDDFDCISDEPAVDLVVHGRVELRRSLKAVTTLAEADQHALVTALCPVDDAMAPAGPADRRTAIRDAVRRHRTRVRLQDAADRIRGMPIAVTNRIGDRLRRLLQCVPWQASVAPAAAAVAGVLGLIMPSSSAAGLRLTPNAASRREPAAASAQPAPPSAGLPVQHEMVHPPAEAKASGSHRAGPVATPPTTAP